MGHLGEEGGHTGSECGVGIVHKNIINSAISHRISTVTHFFTKWLHCLLDFDLETYKVA